MSCFHSRSYETFQYFHDYWIKTDRQDEVYDFIKITRYEEPIDRADTDNALAERQRKIDLHPIKKLRTVLIIEKKKFNLN